jgi:hypothetical protein
MSANYADIKSLRNHANSEINKSIRVRKSRYNIEELNSNSANISKNIGQSCKFYKMKYDNEQTKIIKKYIEKSKFRMLSDHVFGIKIYSNKSKIVGFFNSSGEADSLAIYECSSSVIYKGKFTVI